MGEIIGALKEFIWDIIGFLIPGFLLIILINFFTQPTVGVKNSFLFDWSLFNPTYVIIVLAYILGFLVYSLTLVKNKIQDYIIDKMNGNWIYKYISGYHSDAWILAFSSSELLKAAKQKLEDEGVDNALNMNVRELRNIYMSRNPEMDQKVYTFMFRADLFDHISTILLLLAFFGFSQLLLSIFDIFIFKVDSLHIVLYLCFILLSIPLGNAKRRFDSISRRIPLSNLK